MTALSRGFVFFFKQKTAYEMRISDWSSDVCSSDLRIIVDAGAVVTIDGVIERGESLVDRALLTGESGGCRVGPDDRVQAGTINLERRLIVIVDRVAGDRDVDRMGGRVAIEIAGKGARTGLADRVGAWLGIGRAH